MKSFNISRPDALDGHLESLLLEGLESGELVEVTDEWWEQKRLQLLDKINQKQSKP